MPTWPGPRSSKRRSAERSIDVSFEVVLPKLGFAMHEGILGAWLAEHGAQVLKGQPLYTLESDKAVEEIEAPASGKLAILAQPGKTYVVGTVLARIDA